VCLSSGNKGQDGCVLHHVGGNVVGVVGYSEGMNCCCSNV
jgi:hypothetical protein